MTDSRYEGHTPRTDAMMITSGPHPDKLDKTPYEAMRDHARALELESAQWETSYRKEIAHATELERENTTLRERVRVLERVLEAYDTAFNWPTTTGREAADRNIAMNLARSRHRAALQEKQ